MLLLPVFGGFEVWALNHNSLVEQLMSHDWSWEESHGWSCRVICAVLKICDDYSFELIFLLLDCFFKCGKVRITYSNFTTLLSLGYHLTFS